MTRRTRTLTTPEERARIYDLRAAGASFLEIAAATGRPVGSITKLLHSQGYYTYRELAEARSERAEYRESAIPTRYEDDPRSIRGYL